MDFQAPSNLQEPSFVCISSISAKKKNLMSFYLMDLAVMPRSDARQIVESRCCCCDLCFYQLQMASTKSSKIASMIDRSRNNSSSLFRDVSFYLVDETKDEVSLQFQIL